MPESCVHNNFESDVQVRRLFNDKASSSNPKAMPDKFTAEVTIFCVDCGRRFEFKNFPTTRDPDQAFVLGGGVKVSLPIGPGAPV